MRNYTIRLFTLSALLGLVTAGAGLIGRYAFPDLVWGGLAFLTFLTFLIHYFIFGSARTPNSMVRRMMIGSMLRMFLGVIFLAISMFNLKPVNIFFVVAYCAYFLAFMLFEIWEMRTNLRPDSSTRPKNENA